MKKFLNQLLSLIALTLVALLPAQLFGGNDTKWTAPVKVSLNQQLIHPETELIHLRIQVDKPAGARNIAILPSDESDFVEIAQTSRTGGAKDGKIDVDIIIRYSDLLTQTRVDVNNSPGLFSIVAFKIEFITVDNISGVFISNDIPSTNMGSARITGMTTDEGAPLQGSSIVTASYGKARPSLTELSDGNTNTGLANTSSVIRLFPMPVREGILNIDIPADIQAKSLSIHNALGARVMSLQPSLVPGVTSIPVNQLESGIYFLRLQTVGNQEIVKRFFIRN